MKKFSQFLFISILLLSFIGSGLSAETPDVTGTYELTGVMEMAAGLWIKPDGTYLARFSYGAADWVEEGKWQVTPEGLKLSQPKFKWRNTEEVTFFLPSGTVFTYEAGKLTTTRSGKTIVFLNPNKTPSKRSTTGKPGEGRMLVKGKVLQLDKKILMVKMDDCKMFDVTRLSPEVLQKAKVGETIDVEIPFSAILGSQTCPRK